MVDVSNIRLNMSDNLVNMNYFDKIKKLKVLSNTIYKDIVEDINNKVYDTLTKESYAPVSEYYATPVSEPHIYGRLITEYSTHPKTIPQAYKKKSETPVPLYEPFGDPLSRSVSTIAQMVDMVHKKLEFSILNDSDVLEIFDKITLYINKVQQMEIYNKDNKNMVMIERAIIFKEKMDHIKNRVLVKRGIPLQDPFEKAIQRLLI